MTDLICDLSCKTNVESLDQYLPKAILPVLMENAKMQWNLLVEFIDFLKRIEK